MAVVAWGGKEEARSLIRFGSAPFRKVPAGIRSLLWVSLVCVILVGGCQLTLWFIYKGVQDKVIFFGKTFVPPHLTVSQLLLGESGFLGGATLIELNLLPAMVSVKVLNLTQFFHWVSTPFTYVSADVVECGPGIQIVDPSNGLRVNPMREPHYFKPTGGEVYSRPQ